MAFRAAASDARRMLLPKPWKTASSTLQSTRKYGRLWRLANSQVKYSGGGLPSACRNSCRRVLTGLKTSGSPVSKALMAAAISRSSRTETAASGSPPSSRTAAT